MLGGALCKQAPELNTAAGYGTSPYMLYSGWKEDGEFFYAMEILYGGIPGRPIGDGMDGHSWWPLFENIPTEYLEAYYPLRIDGYTTVTDSGGAGLHRGGNGIEKRYVYLEPGHVSIHDDRWLTRPWGVLGGEPGERSTKLLRRADGTEQVLPAKCDEVEVQPGDMLIYRTAGGGGWKDRLDRPAEAVARDVAVRAGLDARRRRAGYGVVLSDDGTVDEAGHRGRAGPPQRAERGEREGVRLRADAGGRARALRGGDRAPAAAAGAAAAVVAAGVARRRARARARAVGGRRASHVTGVRRFGEAGGFGRRPAVIVVDLSSGSPTRRRRSAPRLDDVVAATRTMLDAAREAGLPVVFTTVVYDDANERAAAVFLRKVPALRVAPARHAWIEVDARLGRRDDEPVLVKAFASAFFGTPLAAILAGHDCLLVCGATTSGCVRATVVDALQHGLMPVVPRECVGDRWPAAHEQALRRLAGNRYGDVVAFTGNGPARCTSPGSSWPSPSPSHCATAMRPSRSTPVSTPWPSSR